MSQTGVNEEVGKRAKQTKPLKTVSPSHSYIVTLQILFSRKAGKIFIHAVPFLHRMILALAELGHD